MSFSGTSLTAHRSPWSTAQVFPSSSKSISSAHVMAELQPLQLATAVGFDTFSVLLFTTLSGIWSYFPLLWMCAFLNGNNTQIQGEFHHTAVVCSCFQFETLKAWFSQSTPSAWLCTAPSVMCLSPLLYLPLYTDATDFQCLTFLFSAGDSLCCTTGASLSCNQARNSSCNPP